MNLSASAWVVNRESLVHVAGDLDLSTAGELAELLTGLIRAGAADLVLDLAGVTFMDCTGLGVLLHARQASLVHGGGLLLVGVPDRVCALLALTGTRGAGGGGRSPAGVVGAPGGQRGQRAWYVKVARSARVHLRPPPALPEGLGRDAYPTSNTRPPARRSPPPELGEAGSDRF